MKMAAAFMKPQHQSKLVHCWRRADLNILANEVLAL
jgi:hypothetical protein